MKKLFSLILAAVLCIGLLPYTITEAAAITPTQPAGSGTEAQPYQIGTAAELYWFANAVNTGNNNIHGELTQDIDLNPGVQFTFVSDTGLVEVKKNGSLICYLGTGVKGDTSGGNSTFDASASTAGRVYAAADSTSSSTDIPADLNLWKPIGDYNDNYAGNGIEYEFVGHFDGKGHTVSGVFSNEYQYSGFFGIMGNASDEDCSIQNVNVADSYICNQSQRTGGILGSLTKGSVSNCSSNALICASMNAGGIVGSASSKTTIENCHFSGDLYSPKTSIGGICGYLTSGEIRNCSSEGDIICSTTTLNAAVGGICGTSQGSASVSALITGCFNSGNVSAPNRQVGGIVGLNSTYASVSKCYNTGSVTAKSRASGICGNSNGLLIEDCFNAGIITANEDAGGICGYLNMGSISNAHNYGKIVGTDAGAVCGENQAGNTAITNTYYLAGTASKGVGNKADAAGYAESKSAEIFAGGDLVDLLNNGRTGEAAVWAQHGQYPVFRSSLPTLTKIEVTAAPSKTTYIEGETFDPAGMVVTAVYSDSSAKEIAVGYTFTPSTALTTGDTQITVSYTEGEITKTAVISLSVLAKVDAQTPDITSQPVSAEYTIGAQALPLRVTASVTDGGTLSYQWFENTASSYPGAKVIPGANQPAFTPSTDTVGEKYYFCLVTNTNPNATGEQTAALASSIAKVAVAAAAPFVPQTGDHTPLMLLALLMTLSLAGMAAVSRKRGMN